MADSPVTAKAAFRAMTQGTARDWRIIDAAGAGFNAGHADRLLGALRSLGDDDGGFQVTRLEHCLQTASRALRDGRDEEYVVCALTHDVGDVLGWANHAQVSAAIMRPYVSDQNHWLLEKHAIFQGYYFYQHVGRNRNLRERYRGHPDFEYTAQFCHLYDQASFDPAYDTLPLEAFEPMLRRVVARPRRASPPPP
jgi:predicted HD phosphohydrolase